MNLDKIIIKIVGMVCVGISVKLIPIMGYFFLIPWTISWLVYDYGSLNPKNKGEK